jgi:hypothetical protein
MSKSWAAACPARGLWNTVWQKTGSTMVAVVGGCLVVESLGEGELK